MNFINDFDAEFLSLLPYCEQQINEYPEPFRTKGLECLRKHNVIENKRTSYICYLLSFWLKDVFGATIENCKAISTGFIFGMLYFFIQDDIYDSVSDENKGEKLLLANLLMVDFMKEYQKLFDAKSPFWFYYKKHIHEWVEFNNWEKSEHWNRFAPFKETDLNKLSGKVAPIKIVNEALALLCSKEELIVPINQMIDYVLVSMQMVDDLSDWKKDLSEQNCTYLLSEAMRYCNLTDFMKLTEVDVRKAIYFGELIEKVIAVIKYNDRCIHDIPVYAPYLSNFHRLLLDDCKNVLNNIQEKKRDALQGGLYHFLKRTEVNVSNENKNRDI